jgi:hypothetical protein
MVAARAGNPEVVHLLVEHRARVEAVESAKGRNALKGVESLTPQRSFVRPLFATGSSAANQSSG